jgi:hypothetical protein
VLLSIVRVGAPAENARLAAALESLSRQVTVWVGLGEDHPIAELVTGPRLFHRYEDLEVAIAQVVQRSLF